MTAHTEIAEMDDTAQELLTREELLDCLRAELQRLAVQLQRDVRAELQNATQELLSKTLVSPLDARSFDADERQAKPRISSREGPQRPSLHPAASGGSPRKSKVAFSSSIMDMADEVFDRKDFYKHETDELSDMPAVSDSLPHLSFSNLRKSLGHALSLPSDDQVRAPVQVAPAVPADLPVAELLLEPVLPNSVDEDQDSTGKNTPPRTQETASRIPGEHDTRPVSAMKPMKSRKDIARPKTKKSRRLHPIVVQLRDKKGCMDQMRYQVARLLHSPFFEVPVLLLIISNAVYVGVQTDYFAKDLRAELPPSFRVADLLFLVLFTLEVVLRLFVHRAGFFTKGEYMWNMFDFGLVVIQILEEIVLAFSDGSMQSLSERLSSSSVLRVVRIVRAARVVRVLRVLRYASELRLLLICILQSYRSFTWAMTILLLMTYVVSIFFTQQATSARADGAQHEGLRQWYSSVGRTVLSLMQGITGGLDWNDLVEPMIEDVSVVSGVLLTAYILFALVAVMNVVLGTFVDSAITRAAEVKKLHIISNAKQLFQAIDIDTSGEITFAEIKCHMHKPAVQEFFRDIDIHWSEADTIFSLLDADGTGSLSINEFMHGCVRFQTTATALDLMLVAQEFRGTFEHLLEEIQLLQ